MARKDYTNLTPTQYLTILENATYTIGEYTYTIAGQLGNRIYIEIYKDGKKQNLSFSIDPEQVKQQLITDGKKEEKKILKEKNKKVHDVKVKLSEEMYQKLKKDVQEQNTTVSEYIRKLIQEKIGE